MRRRRQCESGEPVWRDAAVARLHERQRRDGRTAPARPARTRTRPCPAARPPLMTAARAGALGPVKALLARGAAVDSKDDRRGQTALMWAAAEGHADVVEVLDRGRRRFPRSLGLRLHAAAVCRQRRAHRRRAKVLLKAGADVNETVPVDGTAARLRRAHAARGRERAAAGGDERAFRAGGAPAGRRRQSERRPARLHRPLTRSLRSASPASATTIPAPKDRAA